MSGEGSLVATVNIPGVELVKAGTWHASTGTVTLTASDLESMVAESRDPAIDAVPVKLGHVDPRFDGEPALGWVRNLRLSSDGSTLIGDLMEVPASLADIIGSAYPRRSVEIDWGLPKPGGKRGAVLTGLALLGVTPPAVKGLDDVYRTAASATLTYTLSSDTGGIQPEPADTSDATDQTQEGPMPDIEQPEAEAVEEETTEEATVEEETTEDEQAPVTVDASAPATVTLSQGQYDDLVRGANAGKAALAALDAQRRDQIITTALSEGRLRPSDQEAWRTALDRDEDNTVALLNTLPAQQVLATAAFGSAHAGVDLTEAAWDDFTANLTGKGA